MLYPRDEAPQSATRLHTARRVATGDEPWGGNQSKMGDVRHHASR